MSARLLGLFSIAVLGGLGCGSAPAPAPSVKQVTSLPEPEWIREAKAQQAGPMQLVAEPPAGAEVVTLTPAELRAEIDANRKAAAAKYQGKWLEFEGYAYSIAVPRLPNGSYWPVITLFSSRKLTDSKIVAIWCCSKTPDPWAKFSRNAKLKVRGVLHHEGTLWNCQFTVLEGEPTPEVTPEELAQAFQENAEEAKKKYDGQYLLVRGKMTKPIVFDALPSDVNGTLTGTKGGTLKVPGSKFEMTDLEKIKADEEVVLLGVCEWEAHAKPPTVSLKDASVVSWIKKP